MDHLFNYQWRQQVTTLAWLPRGSHYPWLFQRGHEKYTSFGPTWQTGQGIGTSTVPRGRVEVDPTVSKHM